MVVAVVVFVLDCVILVVESVAEDISDEVVIGFDLMVP